MLSVSVLWKQKLMQLNKRADKEPTEVALEDWGISLIICFTVPAYKAVCVSAAAAPICPDMCLLVIHLQALRDRNREGTVQYVFMPKLNELSSKFNDGVPSEFSLCSSLQKQQQKGGQCTAFFIACVIYALSLWLLGVFFPGTYAIRLRLKSEKIDFQSHHLGVSIGSGGLRC